MRSLSGALVFAFFGIVMLVFSVVECDSCTDKNCPKGTSAHAASVRCADSVFSSWLPKTSRPAGVCEAALDDTTWQLTNAMQGVDK